MSLSSSGRDLISCRTQLAAIPAVLHGVVGDNDFPVVHYVLPVLAGLGSAGCAQSQRYRMGFLGSKGSTFSLADFLS